MSEITIHKCDAMDELHTHYERQTQQQGCYLWLDCDEDEMGCDANPEIGNAVPTRVWHGRVRRYSIPCLTATAANRLMDEARPLAERIVAGYECEWDGNNHVGRLNDDALAAEGEMEHLCDDYGDEDDRVVEWEACDWLNGETMNITANTTDDELDKIQEDIKSSAPGNVVILNLDTQLRTIRDEMRDEAGDESEE